MDLKATKRSAANSLSQAVYSPKKLVAIHTGAMLLLALVLTVLQFLLEQGIADTGGLANLQNRALLSTAQSVLTILNMVALPFWQMGLLFAALRLSRQETAYPTSLLEGFRRWGPLIRLFALEIGIIMLVFFACSYLAGILFSFTPFMEDAIPVMEQMLDPSGALDPSAFSTEMLYKVFMPLYLILLATMTIVGIPLFYRLRLAPYAIMDDTPKAFSALKTSNRLMRRNGFALFRVDLSFWWYYGAKVLVSALPYGYLLPSTLGVTLPLSDTVLYFLLYGLFLVLTLALEWVFGAQVQVTYAHCDNTLKEAAGPPPAPQPFPQPRG